MKAIFLTAFTVLALSLGAVTAHAGVQGVTRAAPDDSIPMSCTQNPSNTEAPPS